VSIRAIRCGTLFDGVAAAPIRDAMVVVDGNRITAVVPPIARRRRRGPSFSI